LKTIEEEKLNVEYMYAFVNKPEKNSSTDLRFDDMDQAIESLQRTGYTILSGKEICAL